MIGTIGRNADKADWSKIPIDLHGDAIRYEAISIREKGVAVPRGYSSLYNPATGRSYIAGNTGTRLGPRLSVFADQSPLTRTVVASSGVNFNLA